MDKDDPIYKQMKSLKEDSDTTIVLEAQNNDSTLRAGLAIERAKIIREVARLILSKEWDSDDTGGINISQNAISNVKHFMEIITHSENKLKTTTRAILREGLEASIKDGLQSLESTLTIWMESIDPKDKPQELVPITELPQLIAKQQPPQQSTQETTQFRENPQESPKENPHPRPQPQQPPGSGQRTPTTRIPKRPSTYL
ncbi:hypothetical protein [Helicobacter ailurogastricus]|uniref:hypothetical protein n=1 Tax=Helicobacter ailurogastricus TaxID=1578720 RepID=UPI000CF0B401|nr:hypothetical protein [Helicobacter ailurogastricus]